MEVFMIRAYLLLICILVAPVWVRWAYARGIVSSIPAAKLHQEMEIFLVTNGQVFVIQPKGHGTLGGICKVDGETTVKIATDSLAHSTNESRLLSQIIEWSSVEKTLSATIISALFFVALAAISGSHRLGAQRKATRVLGLSIIVICVFVTGDLAFRSGIFPMVFLDTFLHSPYHCLLMVFSVGLGSTGPYFGSGNLGKLFPFVVSLIDAIYYLAWFLFVYYFVMKVKSASAMTTTVSTSSPA
jgi:hypothetical protein